MHINFNLLVQMELSYPTPRSFSALFPHFIIIIIIISTNYMLGKRKKGAILGSPLKS